MILNFEVALLVPELKGYQTPKVQSSDVQQQQQQQLSLLSQASWGRLEMYHQSNLIQYCRSPKNILWQPKI
jgi:hypothetical protein